ncbi:unnamed protein product, partial [Brassicogethes aeneus]
EYVETTHLDEGGDVELVKPLKVSPPPLNDHDIIFEQMHNQKTEDVPTSKHHSGHFRHKMAEVWDPYPRYEIYAFGEKLLLELSHDSKFYHPDLQIITHHHDNYTERSRHDPKMAACFYSGTVNKDPDSDVAVSLCHGMTGYIKTSKQAFHIEPAEKFHNNTIGSILHRIHRIHLTPQASNEIFDHNVSEENVEHGTVITDHFPEETRSHHVINKRDVTFDDLDTDSSIDSLHRGEHELVPMKPEPVRSARHAVWNAEVQKRSHEHFVEVMLVVDKSMMDYHRTEEELHHYIMTLMNHVTHLFKDVSVGNSISVNLVYIHILKHKVFNYDHSSDLLRQFCRWQIKNTIKNHDVAFLLTRSTICTGAEDCRFLGVAEVGSMCSEKSCAIVLDKGLSTSYTIAHELGHVLSMPHDNDIRCNEFNKGQGHLNIMNNVMKNDTKPWMWSKCSRHFLSEFLETQKATCLTNPPEKEFKNTGVFMLPGEEFDVNRQCELEFGEGMSVCPYMITCISLWCQDTILGDREGCKTSSMPMAEGTKCGENKWCFQGECTSKNRELLIPVHGGWGPWQRWGPCSRSCGGGVSRSVRSCNNPAPENGGDFCTGKKVKHMSCNTQDCDPKEPDFRALQCARFNGITKNLPNLTNEVEWIPKYVLDIREDLCKLYCRPKSSNAFYVLKDKVEDGTKCGLASFDICVNGICKSAGCDNQLDSSLTLDDCGVCGGDNSKCEKITGVYNRSLTGYNKVVRIPKGSSNIEILQHSDTDHSDSNYLVLVDGETGDYVLNGKHLVMKDQQDLFFGGIIINYTGSDVAIEKITSPRQRKLEKDLLIEVLAVGHVTPANISYSYYINSDSAPRRSDEMAKYDYYRRHYYATRYAWRLYQKQWTKCDSICSGTQEIRPICVETSSGSPVDDGHCDNLDRQHFAQQRPCNTHCQFTWNNVTTGPCSNHCGPGYREITYNCLKVEMRKKAYSGYGQHASAGRSEIVDERYCSQVLAKPPLMETCKGSCPQTRWEYSDWSECSQTCGGGVRHRSARCWDQEGKEIDESNCYSDQKITTQQCNPQKCPYWQESGEWSPCSTTCGRGFKTKRYYCLVDRRVFPHSYCDQSTLPNEREECNERPCNVSWTTTAWGECSATCGEGITRRGVYCQQDNEVHGDEHCRQILKPNDTSACFLTECYPYDDYNYGDYGDNEIASYTWKTSAWTKCSKSCNGGNQTRHVFCEDSFGEKVQEEYCNNEEKPQSLAPCNTHPCPKWIFGGWSNCNSNCEQMRQVSCQNYTGIFVHDEHCDRVKKPDTVQKCKPHQCSYLNEVQNRGEQSRFKWKVGKWKQCDNKCGRGYRRRTVECRDTLNNYTLVDSFCNLKRKPKHQQPCEQYHCKMAWIQGYWSECSQSCGNGVKTRNVSCHRILPDSVIHPEPLDENSIRDPRDFCSSAKRPSNLTTCLLRNCHDEYYWIPGPWSECQGRCGTNEKQIRKLYCVKRANNKKVARKYCSIKLKPIRKRKCPRKPCVYRSCKEIKQHKNTKENRDYTINIGGRLASVYCFKMDTHYPEEFITLQPNPRNYAEFYDKRLLNLATCPNNGERRDNCQCDTIGKGRSGLTTFWKVRVNITTLKIIEDDFTFSNSIKGTSIPYGSSGDCYSSLRGCPQGRFSIDLTLTSFKLARDVEWVNIGSNATSRIYINNEKTIVEGKCGGYCGNCVPNPQTGLKVEVT